MRSPQSAAAGVKTSSKQAETYAWFVVAVLCFAYMVAFIDRMIINLMVGPIRADLGISDTQMSYLQGLSFALFYTLMGIPIARLADRTNRKRIIAAGIAVWSLMTAACGLARTYWMLFVARTGVGIGEAALSPAAYSIIADYFPAQKVSRAISVYTMGLSLGVAVAFILGGVVVGALAANPVTIPGLGVLRPWQLTFFMVSLPGLLVLGLLLFVREPRRREMHQPRLDIGDTGFLDFLKERRRAVGSHLLGFSLLTIVSHGSLAWLPTFLIRVRGLSVEESGMYLGVASLLFGAPGYFFAAWMSERLERSGHPDAIFRVTVMAALAMIPVIALLPFADGVWVYVVIALFLFLIAMPWGIAAASLQLIAPNRFRAQLSALYLFSINLIGLGSGPTLVAVFTDSVFRDEMAVGRSLAVVCSSALILAATTLLWGQRAYGRAVHSMRAPDQRRTG